MSLILITIFLGVCLQPFHSCFFRNARFELFKTIYNIAISPFGKVRFRDFFFADVITSMGQPLVDIGMCYNYFSAGFWTKREALQKDEVKDF